MAKPKLLESKFLFQGYFDVKQDLLEKHDGERLPYTHFQLATDAVVILAQTLEGKLVLTREYRHPTREHLLGCPGGKLEVGEDPIEGGRRELLEETGYKAEEFTVLGCAYPMPAMCNQKVYFLSAKNAVNTGAQRLDPFEFIETELKTLGEVVAEIRKGAILDCHLLTALSMHRASFSEF